jgi:hypothetical protein
MAKSAAGMKVAHALKVVFRPRVVLPLLLAAALLFVALSLGDLGKVIGRVKAIPVWDMLLVLGLAAAYLFLKAVQLHLLLANLGARPGWRRFVLAYAVGELALTFPLGIFAQNWVLSVEDKIHFGRSSAATVVMLLMEIVTVLLVLAVLGVPGWPPVRPVAAGLLIVMGLLMFCLLRFETAIEGWAHQVTLPALQRAVSETIGLVRGLKSLGKPRVLGVNFLMTPAYLGALAGAFLVVGHGVGMPALSYLQATTIYAFALACILLCAGLFGQIGTMEVIGMNAARACGFDYTDGLALMLGFRLAWTGALWLLNGPVVLALWKSVRPGRSASGGSVQGGQESSH